MSAHGEQEQDEYGAALIDQMVAYESGEMEDDEEVLDFFQNLVDSGVAWQLQGHYGRTARALINAGLINDVTDTEGATT